MPPIKTRTIKQLLILLRQYIVDQEDFQGLCGESQEMQTRGIITFDEEIILYNYVINNRKGRIYKLNTSFWWKPGNKPPRLRWCDAHIIIN